MGTKSDMKWRDRSQRLDSESRRTQVEKARKLIFQNGAPVDGQHVKSILNPESLVPTRVSHFRHDDVV